MLKNELFQFAKTLWPIPRSLTGDGVRETLKHIATHLPELKQYEVPSGTQAFDWTVPQEWRVHSARLFSPDGNKILDFNDNNLSLVGYSVPYKGKVTLEELQSHLYSLSDQPNATPYVTSYYSPRWGFCLPEEVRKNLPSGTYDVQIETEHFNGNLTYGEFVIPGESAEEILFSTYVCHPSMANNEISGPVVSTFLARELRQRKKRKYTYRFIFIPETIGSIIYISKNMEHLKKFTKAGFVLSCIGDDRAYSILPSRLGNTYADKVSNRALEMMNGKKVRYSFSDRGSDERQFCSPGVDLPVASLHRTKYAAYPEYHTSLDNFDVVTPEGLLGGYQFAKTVVDLLETDVIYRTAIPCEPQLGKRGLYPTLGTPQSKSIVKNMMDILAYSDGDHSIADLAIFLKITIQEVQEISEKLSQHGLLEVR